MSFVPVDYFPEEMAETLMSIRRNISEFIKTQSVSDITKALINFIIIITVTSLLHWSLINIYISNCIDASWSGAFTNMVRLGSPFCQFINYSQFELSKHYITIWASAGIAIIAWFITKAQANTTS